ncbi:MAG: ankyrin repeat domain-containing protein, partial [Vicinamibacterales bacterium]
SGHSGLVDLFSKGSLSPAAAEAALTFATRRCHLEVVRTLAERGAALDVMPEGSPLIVHAAGSNCLEVVRFLLDNGTAADVRANDGMTALMAAARSGLLPIAELLVEHGADPEAENKRNQSAWYYAAMSGQPQFVEFLRTLREAKGVK